MQDDNFKIQEIQAADDCSEANLQESDEELNDENNNNNGSYHKMDDSIQYQDWARNTINHGNDSDKQQYLLNFDNNRLE